MINCIFLLDHFFSISLVCGHGRRDNPSAFAIAFELL